MKKSLLLLTALAAGAAAQAAEGVDLRFCEDIEGYTGPGVAAEYELYVEIPAEVATRLAGNRVTKLGYSTAYKGSSMRGEIFVDEGVNTKSSTYVDLVDNSNAQFYGYTEYAYDQPYEITADTPFCIGVRFKATADDMPIGIATNSNSFEGHINYKALNSTSWSMYTPSELDMNNLCIYAVTEGPVTELLNFFEVNSARPAFTLPMIEQGDALNYVLTLTNYGTNALTNLTFDFRDAEGNTVPVETTFLISDRLQPVSMLVASSPVTTLGRVATSATVTSINGQAITPVTINMPGIVMPRDSGFTQRVFVEEGTGMWCGFCPRGIVGMDYMEENYPDTFVGVAVHVNDDLSVKNYSSIVSNYFEGFGYPSCVVNRDPRYIMDPNIANLQTAYTRFSEWKSVADISLTLDRVTDSGYWVTSSVQFAQDFPQASFRIAYITVEDGIEGVQTNYFSQTDPANPSAGRFFLNEFWDNQPYQANWTYDNTARGIFTARGVPNSVPSSITAGTVYTHSYDQISSANLTPGHPVKIVAILIDSTTGVVLNSCRISVPSAGIDSVVADDASDAPVLYYNLQGQPVANPESGHVYIRRQGTTAKKVVI